MPTEEFKRLESSAQFRVKRKVGQANELILTAKSNGPKSASRLVQVAAQVIVTDQMARQKTPLHDQATALDKLISERQSRRTALQSDYQAAGRPVRSSPAKPDPAIAAKLEEMKTRRQLLIERFPTHPDIPKLAAQIQQLESQRRSLLSGRPHIGRLATLGKALAETLIQIDILTLKKLGLAQTEKGLRPAWRLKPGLQAARWPRRVEGWPIGASVPIGLILVGFLVTRERRLRAASFADGLWQASSTIPLGVVPSGDDSALQEPPWKVPDDPMSRDAASLYDQWLALVKMLYEPAPAPPKGVMETADLLVRKTVEFLSAGHEALARHLARTGRPDELASHVAHTVLMALMGAVEAGVSAEHARATALAALFHDLALVPRPVAALQEVGSEIGRLSAALVRKISGLTPALAAMIEEILIGMDEFKQSMWQNLSPGKNLEPLANLLRQVDRFEKVMQKQRIRIHTRLAHRAAN